MEKLETEHSKPSTDGIHESTDQDTEKLERNTRPVRQLENPESALLISRQHFNWLIENRKHLKAWDSL
jgi:hypothetical protein